MLELYTIKICDNFCVKHIFVFFHFRFKFVDVGDDQFV